MNHRLLSIIFFIIIVCIILSNALYAEPKDIITWAVNDAPPFYIKKGPNKGKGFGDLTQKLIIELMTEYDHKIVPCTLKRVMWDFKEKKEICFSTWIHNSTPELVYTSAPNIYYFPLGIITLKKTRPQFNGNVVSLDKVMQNKKLVFGQPQGRGYGKKLDTIVEKYRGNENFMVRGAADSTTGIMNMILRGRVDYTFDYPYVMSIFEKEFDKQGQFAFIPIKENQGVGVIGAISCSRSDWGKRVIGDMNKAIIKARTLPRHRKILNEWLIPEGREQEYWALYEEEVLTVFK